MAGMNLDKLVELRHLLNVAHHVPGRIRLQFNNPLVALFAKANLSKLDTLVETIPAFTCYSYNAQTHSIALEYDNQIIPPALLEQLFSPEEVDAKEALRTLEPLVKPQNS